VKKAILLAIGVLVAGGWLFLLLRPYHAPQPQGVPGRPLAPEFSLTDLEGRKLALSGYRGKVILLDFWATWCAPCQTEIPLFVEWQKRYSPRGLQVIGISMDDSAPPVRAFYGKLGINYPVALGSVKVAEDYGGILGLPVNLVIDRSGRIAARHDGMTDLPGLEKEIQALLPAPAKP
jgi:thiol-disulfide isomerase/thioredoxin